MIDMNKKYKTRTGLPVRILCVDRINEFPVVYLVLNEQKEHVITATITGKPSKTGIEEAAWDLIEITPYEDFKIDEPVMVRDLRDYGGGAWFRRYFAGVDDKGRAKTWACGVTSWTIDDGGDYSFWDECRRPTPDEMKPV